MLTFPGRISVVIPAHNAGRFIHQTLQATLEQTYGDVEIIVVDDASSDETLAVAQEFGERLTIIRHDRQLGVSCARNTGVAQSTGSWLAFLDADDWWPPTFLEKAAALLESDRALCYDSIVVADPPGNAPSELSNSQITLHRRAHHWTHRVIDRANLSLMFDDAPLLKSIVHRRAFDSVAGFDARFHGGEDFHFHVKLVAANVTLQLVDEPFGYYRVHQTQATAAISGGAQRDPIRHLASCREWICMFESMCSELRLDPASVIACRTRARYWRYRYAREAILIMLREKTWRFVANREFIRSSWPAMSIALQRIIVRLKDRHI